VGDSIKYLEFEDQKIDYPVFYSGEGVSYYKI